MKAIEVKNGPGNGVSIVKIKEEKGFSKKIVIQVSTCLILLLLVHYSAALKSIQSSISLATVFYNFYVLNLLAISAFPATFLQATSRSTLTISIHLYQINIYF